MAKGRERIVICLDCGAEVKTRYSRTLRCKECAQKHQREQKKIALEKRREQRRMEQGVETEKFTYQFCDSPENIQKCLNCTLPKCKNCLSYGYVKKKDRKKKGDAADDQ
jgi:hypothetical protein